MSTPSFTPRPARSKWERRYWAAQYFLRRIAFLALLVWSAAVCLTQLSGPRWEAAAVGLVCACTVLYVQGGWVWRRYRRWLR